MCLTGGSPSGSPSPPLQATPSEGPLSGIRKTFTSLAPKADPRRVLGLETDPKKQIFGFSKNNELFVGRLAMLGFASSLVGELLTTKGPLAQFNLESGVPLQDAEPLVLFLIAFNLFGAIAPTKGTFVPADEADFDTEPAANKGPLEFLGLNKDRPFGLTKENEIFVGRMAQLGFAASLIGETLTGKGALAQFDIETGLPLSQTEPLLGAFILFFFVFAVIEGSGKFVDDE